MNTVPREGSSDELRPNIVAEGVNTHDRNPRSKGQLLRKAGACAFAGFILAAPLAMEDAIENTHVEDSIAGFPSTLSYTHQGGSQLDLGLMGRVYIPEDDRGIGLSAEIKDLPYSGEPGIFSFFSSGYAARLAGLYSQPEEAVSGAVSALEHQRNENFKDYELRYGLLVGGALLLGASAFRRGETRFRDSSLQQKIATTAGLAVIAAGPSVMAYGNFTNWHGDNPPISDIRLPLTSVKGTALEGITVSNRGLQFAIVDGTTKVETLLARQDQRKDAFIKRAMRELSTQSGNIHQPGENETAILIGSDMHDNEAMTDVTKQTVAMINDIYEDGTINTIISAGDLGYGSSLEQRYIKEQATMASHVVVSPGNHDTTITEQEMDQAGILRIKNKPLLVDGITIYGGEDPLVTPLGSPTVPRGESADHNTLERDLGDSIYQQGQTEPTNVTSLHEGYAAGAYLGMETVTKDRMTKWFSERGSTSIPWEDGVRDLPTSLLIYGHWHRMIEPRVVWNSDGSHTLVMELNTMGGAIGSPTINHFSTPNDAPGQTASFAIVYLDNSTKLINGYQMYSFEPDGATAISDYVPIGSPIGEDASRARSDRSTAKR